MARPKKTNIQSDVASLSEFDIKIQEMRNGRIDREYLTKLVMEYKFKKNIDKAYPMPRELGAVVLVIIDKMIGSSSWRNYTEDWKDEFRGRAIEHVLRYAHNFNPEKMEAGKNDPFNYFAMIISHAFIQSLRKCKAYAERKVVINDDVLYNATSWAELYDASPDIFTNPTNYDNEI